MTYNEKLAFTKKNYNKMSNPDIAAAIGVTLSCVQNYARKLGLKKDKNFNKNSFNEAKVSLIHKYYPKGDLDWLCKQTGQNRHALSEWARRNGIKREVSGLRQGSIERLLDDSPESFYWLGFLSADGYISKDGHLMASQSEKDIDHIQLFADYCGKSLYKIAEHGSGSYTNAQASYRVNIYDKDIGGKIRREYWGLADDEQKTYKSISLDFLQDKEMSLCFLIGFICGDGSCKSSSAQIEVYQTWYNTLQELMYKCNFTESDYSLCYRPGRGRSSDKYAYLYIKNSGINQLLKIIDQYNLPINTRKWDKCR